MNIYIKKNHAHYPLKIFTLFLSLTFIASTLIFPVSLSAQSIRSTVLNLPEPGTMLNFSEKYVPVMMRGITLDASNPLKMDFIIDTGETKMRGEELNNEARKLIQYFMATLTVPEEELWVNLSPYEKDRIIADSFSETIMGRDLLAQDYLLKQLSASVVYPEDELGKKFWKKVYKTAQDLFGTNKVPVNTFNKIWIVPDKAVVYTSGPSAFIIESHLKVMLEEDYVALQENLGKSEFGTKNTETEKIEKVSDISSKVIREVMLPEIEKEINTGETFANLRQIYNSMILGAWYKINLKQSLLGQVYVDQNKVKGVDVEDKEIREKIYQQYLTAFRKGVYDFVRKEKDLKTKKPVYRKYYSGGFRAVNLFTELRRPTSTINRPSTGFASLPIGEQRRITSGTTNSHPDSNIFAITALQTEMSSNVYGPLADALREGSIGQPVSLTASRAMLGESRYTSELENRVVAISQVGGSTERDRSDRLESTRDVLRSYPIDTVVQLRWSIQSKARFTNTDIGNSSEILAHLAAIIGEREASDRRTDENRAMLGSLEEEYGDLISGFIELTRAQPIRSESDRADFFGRVGDTMSGYTPTAITAMEALLERRGELPESPTIRLALATAKGNKTVASDRLGEARVLDRVVELARAQPITNEAARADFFGRVGGLLSGYSPAEITEIESIFSRREEIPESPGIRLALATVRGDKEAARVSRGLRNSIMGGGHTSNEAMLADAREEALDRMKELSQRQISSDADRARLFQEVGDVVMGFTPIDIADIESQLGEFPEASAAGIRLALVTQRGRIESQLEQAKLDQALDRMIELSQRPISTEADRDEFFQQVGNVATGYTSSDLSVIESQLEGRSEVPEASAAGIRLALARERFNKEEQPARTELNQAIDRMRELSQRQISTDDERSRLFQEVGDVVMGFTPIDIIDIERQLEGRTEVPEATAAGIRLALVTQIGEKESRLEQARLDQALGRVIALARSTDIERSQALEQIDNVLIGFTPSEISVIERNYTARGEVEGTRIRVSRVLGTVRTRKEEAAVVNRAMFAPVEIEANRNLTTSIQRDVDEIISRVPGLRDQDRSIPILEIDEGVINEMYLAANRKFGINLVYNPTSIGGAKLGDFQRIVFAEMTRPADPTQRRTSDGTPPGGIDLNPQLLDLQIKRDESGIPLPVYDQPIENMNIDGFLPVIINVTPVSIPLLMGSNEEEKTPDQLSSLYSE